MSARPSPSGSTETLKRGALPILFVDDEPSLRLLFRRQMRRQGFDVHLAADVEEATALATTIEFGAVVTELQMPGNNGLELIRRLQTVSPDLSVVLVSGDQRLAIPDDQWIDRTLVSIIPKPWDTSELLTVLDRAILLTQRRSLENEDAAPSQDHLRILLVEDCPGDSDYFRFLCEEARLEAEVQTFERLDQAVEALRSEHWDLAVTDLSLPDARGLDTVHRLRQASQSAPIVVFSSRTEYGEDAVRLGAQAYLDKADLTPETLARSLRIAVERKRHEDRLRRLADQDSLTGLGNRSFFRSRLNHALARARRSFSCVALLFVDLDRFKDINDRWGHNTGDLILQAVATRLQGVIREGDTLARLGGDEFAIVLENIISLEEATQVAERVRIDLSVPHPIGEEEIQATPSIGISLFPEHGDTAEGLLGLADRAMYRAKHEGGGRYKLHNEEATPSNPEPAPGPHRTRDPK